MSVICLTNPLAFEFKMPCIRQLANSSHPLRNGLHGERFGGGSPHLAASAPEDLGETLVVRGLGHDDTLSMHYLMVSISTRISKGVTKGQIARLSSDASTNSRRPADEVEPRLRLRRHGAVEPLSVASEFIPLRFSPAASHSPDRRATPESPSPGAPSPECPFPPSYRPPQAPASPSPAQVTSRP